MATRRVISLLIALFAGLVGFRDEIFGRMLSPGAYAGLQELFGSVLTGLCKVVFVFLILFYVVSLCFGKHLRGGHS